MAMTPKELAARLGTNPKRVREVLRDIYRPNGENKNARWHLDDDMVATVTRRLQSNER